MNATAMHYDLFTTLGIDALSYPIVTRILREALSTHKQSPAEKLAVDLHPSAIDSAITQALSIEPFALVHLLAQRMCLPKSSVFHHVVNIVGFATKCPSCGPRTLSQDKKQVLAEMSQSLLAQIGSAKHTGRGNLGTFDEI
jgi:hypothetical protein